MSSNLESARLLWDADGVLVDSQRLSHDFAQQIVALLGKNGKIDSQEDYRSFFGVGSELGVLGNSKDAETMREFHRLVVRERAAVIPVFEEACRLHREFEEISAVITAAYGRAIIDALSAHGFSGFTVVGREAGKKEDVLRKIASQGRSVCYITDTITDIRRCKRAGMPVVAVTWGYDKVSDILANQPDAIASTVSELREILQKQLLVLP